MAKHAAGQACLRKASGRRGRRPSCQADCATILLAKIRARVGPQGCPCGGARFARGQHARPG
eukprot:9220722-Lingulodinium_polyedra.AAC.1